ncbi:Uncharacterized protein FWK35_00024784 [Aphis craccivora]|uniref:Uncharacterized protein n=1 Tax=Aphis craccivora TaxID=307492 RepID=A0A6G0Y3X5_APHCR|nr:Uncharacterized protein FWK35_00024784 [Aphis craccivora]
MGGRKCNYDKQELVEILKLFKTGILNAFGKSTDPLDRICFHFGNKIKPAALYTIIKCNRLNCHDILGISDKADSENDEDDDVSSLTSLSENNYDDNEKNMYNKPIINEPVRFSYSMNNLNEKKHFNIMKRPLSGIKRNNVLKRLCDEKMTVNWRREHVSENLNNHKLYLLDVLCKSRQEYKDKTQFKEMSSEKNVLESLLCLKYEEYYYSSIHKIGLDPIPQELDEEEDVDGCLNEWILSIEHIAREKYVTESTDLSFVKLLKTYPLWSAIITQHYDFNELTASAVSVESYFNDFKNRSFHNHKLPIRADKFVCKYVKEIESMLKLLDHNLKVEDNMVDLIEKYAICIDLKSEKPAEIFEN